jgi:hypothetical protein
VRYESYETAVCDIDGDGASETIKYELVQTGDWEYTTNIIINGKTFDLSEYYYPETPLDGFYLTDIASYDGKLEIAILDEGPSYDPYTMFFRYEEGALSYIGMVDGFPFKEQNSGRYGFDGGNLVMGTARADLIETSYLDCYWWYDSSAGTLSMQEGAMCSYQTFNPHKLYVDLPIYITMDEDSPTRLLKAQEEVFFLASDLKEWILVEGKDGTRGYVHVADYTITNNNLPEEEVFSSVGYFD